MITMSLSYLSKSLISVAGTFGLVTISNLLLIDPAGAFDISFSNGGFEDSTTGWTTTGDVTTNTTGISGVNPVSDSSQGIITNSHKDTSDRIDDNGLVFNQSGTNPVDADTIPTNHSGQDLQTFLGLDQNALSIARNPVVSGFNRTPKEASGMYQDLSFTVLAADVTSGKNGFEISFNWAYLSNDGRENTFGLGNQDYSFVSIYNRALSPGAITVLGDSDQAISNPSSNTNFVHTNTNNYSAGSTYKQSFTGLAVGTYTYRVGLGVVDVDNYDRSSALLLDGFQARQVPFEFSPTAGLVLVAGAFGVKNMLKKAGSKVPE
jgi:hypothetical protein